jgi:hypothetical protein
MMMVKDTAGWREVERYGGKLKDMAGKSKIWREVERYGGKSEDMAGNSIDQHHHHSNSP